MGSGVAQIVGFAVDGCEEISPGVGGAYGNQDKGLTAADELDGFFLVFRQAWNAQGTAALRGDTTPCRSLTRGFLLRGFSTTWEVDNVVHNLSMPLRFVKQWLVM